MSTVDLISGYYGKLFPFARIYIRRFEPERPPPPPSLIANREKKYKHRRIANGHNPWLNRYAARYR